MKLSNTPTQHREVPVPRRQDVDKRPCVPRLELNGPALRHFESQPDSPELFRGSLESSSQHQGRQAEEGNYTYYIGKCSQDNTAGNRRVDAKLA